MQSRISRFVGLLGNDEQRSLKCLPLAVAVSVMEDASSSEFGGERDMQDGFGVPDQRSDEEAQRLADDVLRRMLNTPPKRQKDAIKEFDVRPSGRQYRRERTGGQGDQDRPK
jgi:hypothetical protein